MQTCKSRLSSSANLSHANSVRNKLSHEIWNARIHGVKLVLFFPYVGAVNKELPGLIGPQLCGAMAEIIEDSRSLKAAFGLPYCLIHLDD